MLSRADVASFKPLRRRADLARAVLVAILLLDLFAIWSSQSEHGLLGRMEAGAFVTDSEILFNDRRQAVIGITQLGLWILCVIVFIAWFSRAYRNIGALGANDLRYSPRWAIGAWFVPFLNLVRPAKIANDIWRGSDPEVQLDRQRRWRELDPPVWLLAWWLAFLFAGWSGRIADRYAGGATISELQSLDRAWMVADSLDALAAVLAIVVVTALTRRQGSRYERAQQALAAGDDDLRVALAG